MEIQEYVDVLMDELRAWAEAAVAALPNAALALVVIITFVIAATFTSRVVARVLSRFSGSPTLTRLGAAVAKIAVLAAGLFFGLGILGLQKTVVSLLAGVGILGLAIGFAFQDLVANFIAGVLMAIRKPFRTGDVVESNGHLGTVLRLDLRSTVLETFAGLTVDIPNKQVFENPLVNYNTKGTRRVDVSVGVAYDTDLEQATRVAKEAIEAFDFRAPESGVDVLAKGFGESSIDFDVRFWIRFPGDVGWLDARHRAVLAIRQAFAKSDIVIPFPIRTLEFAGGAALKVEAASA